MIKSKKSPEILKPFRVALIADLHGGNETGLHLPEFNWKPAEADSEKKHKRYEFRVNLGKWFTQEIRINGPYTHAIWLGDLTDGKGEKSEGSEDSEVPFQIKSSIAIVKYVGAEKNYFVRGTGYHVGKALSCSEDSIAEAFGTTLLDEAVIDFNGLIVQARHKISSTSSPASRSTALNSTMIRQLLYAELGLQPIANLILRAHAHRTMGVSDYAANKMAVSLPCLEGSTVFGSGLDGLPINLGFGVLSGVSKTDWGVDICLAPIKFLKNEVIKG
jgi:hypothetical protein